MALMQDTHVSGPPEPPLPPTTPWLALVYDRRISERNATPGWTWRAALPMWAWHEVLLGDYPGWDMVGDAPPFVKLEHVGSDTSWRLATKWDDIAVGVFYYRDWTSSGTPCVADGEVYWSGFWFEKMDDARAFHAKYGGEASWEVGP